MITITNNYVIYSKDLVEQNKDYFNSLLSYFTYKDTKIETDEIVELPLYTIDDAGNVLFPLGYYHYLPIHQLSLQVTDKRSFVIARLSSGVNQYDISNLLPGITLRSDQVGVVKQAVSGRSGIYQMATGSGKTEVISAIIKYWQTVVGITPNILILEPTVNLVKQTIGRLYRYGITATEYGSSREINGVQVTHPMSLVNDLEKNCLHLANLHVIICDEGHHLTAKTWRAILDNAPMLECRFALSASVINIDHINTVTLEAMFDKLDYEELLVLGAVGPLVCLFTPAYYIKANVLATPVVFRMLNAADEKIKRDLMYSKRYHEIKKKRLGSSKRLKTCVDTVRQLPHLKKLILVGTKQQAYDMVRTFNSAGYADRVRLIFGNDTYLKYDKVKDKFIDEKENVVQMLTNGQIDVIIGTSVLYEGADLPLLDMVVLYSVGIDQRIFIQTIGRVLRRGKTGKYAYIVDFTDHECDLLRRHSLLRREMYETVIGVATNRIFDGLRVSDIYGLYTRLEN